MTRTQSENCKYMWDITQTKEKKCNIKPTN